MNLERLSGQQWLWAFIPPLRGSGAYLAVTTLTAGCVQPFPKLKKTMLSIEQLLKLLTAAEHATPGPWDFHGQNCRFEIAQLEGTRLTKRIVHGEFAEHGGVDNYSDANFIALANPQTVRAMIDEIITIRTEEQTKSVVTE